MRTWANAASALGVFANLYEPLAAADFRVTFDDPTCPSIEDDGTTMTITGGCTDTDGVERLGVAIVVREGDDRMLVLDAYGEDRDGRRREVTGTASVISIGPASYQWSTDHTIEGGVTTSVTYDGTLEGTYDEPTFWNGQGEVERDGVVAPAGRVTATTVDQVRFDSTCPGESLSGQTTVADSAHTAVITYDGETDCDEEHTAQWAFDGADQGPITGISCAASSGRGSPLPFAIFLIALSRQNRRSVYRARSDPQRPSSSHAMRKIAIV